MDAVHEGSSGGPVLMPESMLHACVLGEADAALLASARQLNVEAGVRWVVAGNVAAFDATTKNRRVATETFICDAQERVSLSISERVQREQVYF